jgi:protein-arginine kinase activator protein McsA
MIFNEKYREFVKTYEQDLESFKKDANQCDDPAKKLLANIMERIAHKMYPLTIKEWMDRELNEAIEKEDFEYAKQVKTEIEKL